MDKGIFLHYKDWARYVCMQTSRKFKKKNSSFNITLIYTINSQMLNFWHRPASPLQDVR